jgi:peptide/nickel transport system substrate-binding protein
MRIQATESTSAYQHAANGDFEAFLWGWNGRIDPDGNISSILGCNAAYNYMHYCSPEVDHELDTARMLDARAERLAHYRMLPSISCRIGRSLISTIPNGYTRRAPDCRGSPPTPMA